MSKSGERPTAAGRFDTPLTVSPRQVQRRRDLKPLIIGAAAVGAVAALIGGLILWWPSSDGADPPADAAETPSVTPTSVPTTSAEEAQLLRFVPGGYPADACHSTAPSENILAQMDCAENIDSGGPLSGTYRLLGDKAALDTEFNAATAKATRVDCPGRIQSPGPWRRNARLDQVSGQLFCGLQDGQPTIVWTDDARMTISAVRAGPQGPTFPQLYAWWSSHS